MDARVPVETLSEDEVGKVRAMVEATNVNDAARRLWIHCRTLWKAMAGLPVHRLTATTIRARLEQLNRG